MAYLAVKLGTSCLLFASAVSGGCGIYNLVNPKTVEEHLIKEGLRPLDTEGIDEDDDDIEDYPDYSHGKSIIEKIEPSGTSGKIFSSWTESYDQEENDEVSKINGLKEQCEYTLEVTREEEGFDTDLANAREFCAIKESK